MELRNQSEPAQLITCTICERKGVEFSPVDRTICTVCWMLSIEVQRYLVDLGCRSKWTLNLYAWLRALIGSGASIADPPLPPEDRCAGPRKVPTPQEDLEVFANFAETSCSISLKQITEIEDRVNLGTMTGLLIYVSCFVIAHNRKVSTYVRMPEVLGQALIRHQKTASDDVYLMRELMRAIYPFLHAFNKRNGDVAYTAHLLAVLLSMQEYCKMKQWLGENAVIDYVMHTIRNTEGTLGDVCMAKVVKLFQLAEAKPEKEIKQTSSFMPQGTVRTNLYQLLETETLGKTPSWDKVEIIRSKVGHETPADLLLHLLCATIQLHHKTSGLFPPLPDSLHTLIIEFLNGTKTWTRSDMVALGTIQVLMPYLVWCSKKRKIQDQLYVQTSLYRTIEFIRKLPTSNVYRGTALTLAVAAYNDILQPKLTLSKLTRDSIESYLRQKQVTHLLLGSNSLPRLKSSTLSNERTPQSTRKNYLSAPDNGKNPPSPTKFPTPTTKVPTIKPQSAFNRTLKLNKRVTVKKKGL